MHKRTACCFTVKSPVTTQHWWQVTWCCKEVSGCLPLISRCPGRLHCSSSSVTAEFSLIFVGMTISVKCTEWGIFLYKFSGFILKRLTHPAGLFKNTVTSVCPKSFCLKSSPWCKLLFVSKPLAFAVAQVQTADHTSPDTFFLCKTNTDPSGLDHQMVILDYCNFRNITLATKYNVIFYK